MISIDRRRFLSMTAGGLMSLSLGTKASAANAGKNKKLPNLIVILADDLGAKELSCYGNKEHETPRLDQLAETGVRFETCYTAPICHPTRFEIMTGQYGCHNGVYHFAGRRGGPEEDSPEDDIALNRVTFAQMLKPRGYATVLSGKWQLSGKLPTLIRECGFDEYCMWAYLYNLPEGVEHTGGWENPGKKPARYWNPSIVKNGEYMPTEKDDYGPDIFTAFLIDFIKQHKEEPFFAYYPMCLTHEPHERTPDNIHLDDKDFASIKAKFKGCVEYLDKLVGRIVDTLDELGLRENTIIFFVGDNGTGGSGKGQVTELGARVPMIVNAPGIVKPRGATGELTDTSDIFPTLADFAGAELPKDRVIDGKSYAPFLRGATDTTRDWIFAYLGDGRILRTKRYLLEKNTPSQWGDLYDCGTSRDGAGYKNVTGSDDPEVKAITKEFKKLLEDLPAPIIEEDEPPPKKKLKNLKSLLKKHRNK